MAKIDINTLTPANEGDNGLKVIDQSNILKIDTAEPKTMLGKFDKQGIKYSYESCQPYGDYLYKDICVERKDISDFIQSIQSKHIHKQMMIMEEAMKSDVFKRCFLVIIGSHKQLYAKGEIIRRTRGFNPYAKWTQNHHVGSIVAMSTDFPNINIIQVENETQFVYAIKRIIERLENPKPRTYMDTELFFKKMTTDDIKTKMLSCIPSLGLDRAKKVSEIANIKILNKNGQPITDTELYRIHGIGTSISGEILKINGL